MRRLEVALLAGTAATFAACLAFTPEGIYACDDGRCTTDAGPTDTVLSGCDGRPAGASCAANTGRCSSIGACMPADACESDGDCASRGFPSGIGCVSGRCEATACTSLHGCPVGGTWCWGKKCVPDTTTADGDYTGWVARWSEDTRPPRPPARGGQAMTWDEQRRVVVMFGGAAVGTAFDDLWSWDGAVWRQAVKKQPWPEARTGATMGYDTFAHRVVLLGGLRADGSLVEDGQVWAWDGSEWTSTPAPAGLLPRARASAVTLSSATASMFLFGGLDQQRRATNDTWIKNAGGWLLLTTATAPSPRVGAGAAYDPSTGAVWLVGGVDGSDASRYVEDTWLFDTSLRSWSRLSAGTTPMMPRADAAVAYDPGRSSVVVVGGESATGVQADVLELRASDGRLGVAALEGGTGTSPPRAARHAMVYDPERHKLVLFGGQDGDQWLDRTWEWNDVLRRGASSEPCAINADCASFICRGGTTCE